MKPYYEKNRILDDYTVNVTFHEILNMTSAEFNDWVLHMRAGLLSSWDQTGSPARLGKNLEGIIEDFNDTNAADTSEFLKVDELTNEKCVVQNTQYCGSTVDQFFTNMMKVPMCYGKDKVGYSVYDLLSKDEHKNRVLKRSHRHFRKDSFYHYSMCGKINDKKSCMISVKTADEWLNAYFDGKLHEDCEFWLHEVEIKTGKSTGYKQFVQDDFLKLNSTEVLSLLPKLKQNHISNIDVNNLKDNCYYMIRIYDKTSRMFPKAFTAFRIGYLSVPVNFPPLTAKFLYEKYTSNVTQDKTAIVYDPSSGWGGRILGAMSANRPIHYIGTDPNPDNVFVDGKTKYEHIAEFYNNNVNSSLFFDGNTYDIFTDGSEEIYKNPRFQQYKGKIDLIFTSPPYFNRELYSMDPNQSAVKYGSSYESWRDGFLKPTLNTCYEYLKPGGYLLWNIADVLTEGEYLPLEQDSIDCLLSLGMKQEIVLKMQLASMPGAQRLDENGIPKCKNYCKINGRYVKYEPIYVFRKDL